jgi:hypothetical protein
LYSLASGATKADPEQAEVYAAQAVKLLEKAQAAGFFKDSKKVIHMKKDTDLDPLRSRADYRQFLNLLKAKAKP